MIKSLEGSGEQLITPSNGNTLASVVRSQVIPQGGSVPQEIS